MPTFLFSTLFPLIYYLLFSYLHTYFFVCPILRFTFLCSILSFHSFANSHFPCVPFLFSHLLLSTFPRFIPFPSFFTLLFFSSYSFTAPIFCSVPSSHFSSCYPLIPSLLVFSSSFLNPIPTHSPPPPCTGFPATAYGPVAAAAAVAAARGSGRGAHGRGGYAAYPQSTGQGKRSGCRSVWLLLSPCCS